jgi:hypothetical protein
VQRALHDKNAARFESMRKVREKSASAIVKIAGNTCAAGVFVIREIDALQSQHAIATHRAALKAGRADSESLFLAMKKFSWFSRWRLIGPRQNRFFERIAGADSRPCFDRAMRHYETPSVGGDSTRPIARDVAPRSDAEVALQ